MVDKIVDPGTGGSPANGGTGTPPVTVVKHKHSIDWSTIVTVGVVVLIVALILTHLP